MQQFHILCNLEKNDASHLDGPGRRRGLAVERRTPEQEVGGSILSQVAVLCP